MANKRTCFSIGISLLIAVITIQKSTAQTTYPYAQHVYQRVYWASPNEHPKRIIRTAGDKHVVLGDDGSTSINAYLFDSLGSFSNNQNYTSGTGQPILAHSVIERSSGNFAISALRNTNNALVYNIDNNLVPIAGQRYEHTVLFPAGKTPVYNSKVLENNANCLKLIHSGNISTAPATIGISMVSLHGFLASNSYGKQYSATFDMDLQEALINGGYMYFIGNDITSGTQGYIICTDTGGAVQWSQTYSFAGQMVQFAKAKIDGSGNLILTGKVSRTGIGCTELLMLNVNSATGAINKQVAYNYTCPESGTSLEMLDNGDFVFSGIDNGGSEALLIRVNSNFDFIWAQNFGPAGTNKMVDITKTIYNKIMGLGQFGVSPATEHGVIVKTDLTGFSGCSQSAVSMGENPITLAASGFTVNTISASYSGNNIGNTTYTLTIVINNSVPAITTSNCECNINPTFSSVTGACWGQSSTFNGYAPNATNYKWFVDGNQVSTNQNYIFSGAELRDYTVRFEAYNQYCGSYQSKTFTIYQKPSPDFTFSRNGLTVTFTAVENHSDYSWNIDGNTYTSNPLTYTFAAGGVYHICLTIQACGSVTKCKDICISSGLSVPTMDADNTTICAGTAVNFSSSGATKYYWTVNNLLFSTNATNSYHFYKAGTYMVHLKTVSDCSQMLEFNEMDKTITVLPAHVNPDFVVGSNVTSQTSAIVYLGATPAGCSSYTWTENSTTVGTGQSISFNTTPGHHAYTLTVTTVCGTDAMTKDVCITDGIIDCCACGTQ